MGLVRRRGQQGFSCVLVWSGRGDGPGMGTRGVGRHWAKRRRDQHLLPKTTPLTQENCPVRWSQNPGSSEFFYRHFSIVEPLSRVVDSPFKHIHYIRTQFVISSCSWYEGAPVVTRSASLDRKFSLRSLSMARKIPLVK
jgi:hypothetical protein